jgi:hypothetical protein
METLAASLVRYLLLAMATWVPHVQHAAVENFDVTEERYEEFAQDTARAMLDEDVDPIPFVPGDEINNRAESALLLASIASDESYYRADVMSCAPPTPDAPGDDGHSWGPFQTSRNRRSTCTSFEGAARVALEMVRESWRICAKLPFEARLAEYTDGFRWDTARADRRSRVKVGRMLRFWVAHPFHAPGLDAEPVRTPRTAAR